MNKIILMGITTAEMELKQTNAGKSVTTFSLAVKRPFTKDATDFHNIVAWDKQAELAANYVRKGDMIAIEGYLTNRSYNAQDGSKRYVTEVIAEKIHFTGSKQETQAEQAAPAYNPFAPNKATQFEELPNDSDLPF